MYMNQGPHLYNAHRIGFDTKFHRFYPTSKVRNKSGFIKVETDMKMFLCIC